MLNDAGKNHLCACPQVILATESDYAAYRQAESIFRAIPVAKPYGPSTKQSYSTLSLPTTLLPGTPETCGARTTTHYHLRSLQSIGHPISAPQYIAGPPAAASSSQNQGPRLVHTR